MRNKWLAAPYVGWMALFVVAPLVLVVVYALTTRDGAFTLDNFSSMLQYASVFGRSFLLAGIAKARDDMGRADRRAGNVGDRIFLPGRSNPLPLRDGSAELLFLQHIRDTAHHFVIGRHRRARAGAALSAELLRIPGVGKATARLLWDHFKALDAIIAATPAQLAAIPGIGPRKAEALAGSLKRLKE